MGWCWDNIKKDGKCRCGSVVIMEYGFGGKGYESNGTTCLECGFGKVYPSGQSPSSVIKKSYKLTLEEINHERDTYGLPPIKKIRN